ncbi:uncharacterized protein DS421_15g504860 [Arachis hypogaea]|nr:uncharacterized protein DS421_15g504860 [Arachis hypogaea]
MKERKEERKGGDGKGSAGMRREKGMAPAGVTAAAPPCCTGEGERAKNRQEREESCTGKREGMEI